VLVHSDAASLQSRLKLDEPAVAPCRGPDGSWMVTKNGRRQLVVTIESVEHDSAQRPRPSTPGWSRDGVEGGNPWQKKAWLARAHRDGWVETGLPARPPRVPHPGADSGGPVDIWARRIRKRRGASPSRFKRPRRGGIDGLPGRGKLEKALTWSCSTATPPA